MPIRILAIAMVLMSGLQAAKADALMREARAAEARFDSESALELFLKADVARPNDPVILQKIARQYSDLSFDTSDPAEQRHLCTEALAYAQRAVVLAPRDPVNVLSLAVCYGKIASVSDMRTKIAHSRRVKEYAEQALALNPDYGYAHHVLGQWHYQVASIGAAARFMLRLVYGGLPEASTAEGVRQLQRAVALEPALPAHHVELGFALLADGRPMAARREFEQTLALPICEKYDDMARRRAREALAKL